MIKIYLSRILGERRWTQKELSSRTGIRAATINEIYHELCDRIKLEHLGAICKALDCTVEDILKYVPDKFGK